MAFAPLSERGIGIKEEIPPFDPRSCFKSTEPPVFTPLGSSLFKLGIDILSLAHQDGLTLQARMEQEARQTLGQIISFVGLPDSPQSRKVILSWVGQLNLHLAEKVFGQGTMFQLPLDSKSHFLKTLIEDNV